MPKVAKEVARRPVQSLARTGTDVILTCFSIDSPDSLEIIAPATGRPQVRHFCPNVPIIIAGSKKGLRNALRTMPECAKKLLEDRLRSLSRTGTDVILMCFSIDSPDSLENIAPASGRSQVRHFCPNVPIIIAGSKKGLRNALRTMPALAKEKWLEDRLRSPHSLENIAPPSGGRKCATCAPTCPSS
ncbi:rho-related GTP-binding protein RhoC-like [Rhipicephalus sanguineus]|uniref:rho-related GTP-binding protein RhoC-like n=1 Tax=Rhipicephalus sanguineus TaxID=34632 RepID=UPI001893E0F3|nr:rho-related GTP-binding protein RhoC-like [Rhipicephalus sanguineus]